MVKHTDKKDLNRLIKQLKDNGFTVTHDGTGWWQAKDDTVMVMASLPHGDGTFMVRLNDDYFSE